MPAEASVAFGDIVLVPFPFTDQTSAKRRPAVVVSSEAYNDARPDVILMAVTSQIRPSGDFAEVRIEDWKAAGLLKPSAIKPVITTLERRLLLRRLGSLIDADQAELRTAITHIIG
ncbi:type II toxin-antitoxin system PemK/MazF family toxin [soil metagenome]